MTRRAFIISSFMLGVLACMGIRRDKTIDELLDEGTRHEWGYYFDRAHSPKEMEMMISWMRKHEDEFTSKNFPPCVFVDPMGDAGGFTLGNTR